MSESDSDWDASLLQYTLHEGDDLDQRKLGAAAELFSDHYGVWGPEVRKIASQQKAPKMGEYHDFRLRPLGRGPDEADPEQENP
jgi:hypothetical protein